VRTREEAVALARLFLDELGAGGTPEIERATSERSGSLVSGPLDLHLGAEASRDRLRGDLRGYSVLHLAAHGFVDRNSPRRTGLALSFTGEEDGYLTIEDVLELDLDADLVVLSGCETARGEVRSGEGIESMARAFLHAGARGVVASLWQLDDRAAADTMERFYEGWQRGGAPIGRSLREAKLELRRAADTVHPFYWAPFVYVGFPR
jgi:CHAT domain-containing protein